MVETCSNATLFRALQNVVFEGLTYETFEELKDFDSQSVTDMELAVITL